MRSVENFFDTMKLRAFQGTRDICFNEIFIVIIYGHIGAMDTFARALLIAEKIMKDGVFDSFVKERYAGFAQGFGKDIIGGKSSFDKLEKIVLKNGGPSQKSGRQEMLENIINQYIN